MIYYSNDGNNLKCHIWYKQLLSTFTLKQVENIHLMTPEHS